MHQAVALPLAGLSQVDPVTFGPVRARQTADVEQAGVTVLLICASLAGGLMLLILAARQRDQAQRDSARDIYQLVFPQDLTADQVTAFIRALLGLRPPRWSLLGRPSLVFETIARGQTIEHRLRLPRDEAEEVFAQLRAAVPGVRTVRVDPGTSLPRLAVAQELRLTDAALPIRTDQASTFAASMLHALSTVEAGETAVVQLVVFPVGWPTSAPTTKPSEIKFWPGWVKAATQLLATKPETRDRKALKSKTSEPLLAVAARTGALSSQRGRSRQLTGRLVGTLKQLDQPGARLAIRSLPPVWQ